MYIMAVQLEASQISSDDLYLCPQIQKLLAHPSPDTGLLGLFSSLWWAGRGLFHNKCFPHRFCVCSAIWHSNKTCLLRAAWLWLFLVNSLFLSSDIFTFVICELYRFKMYRESDIHLINHFKTQLYQSFKELSNDGGNYQLSTFLLL